ncbi:MAG: hypothetical protein IJ738_03630 [Alphaproteobacteria bacterium]|nr:hypothetical protein [Alphaproteobacteria bacterium]
MNDESTINKTEDLYYYIERDAVSLELGGTIKYKERIKLRRSYNLTKADKALFDAKTAEETQEALKRGANPNAERGTGQNLKSLMSYREFDNRFETPLMEANAEQTKLLLEAGADPNLGRVAVKYGHAMDFAKNENGITPLVHAIWQKDIKKMKLLIRAGADVNAVDIDGNSVLMHAFNAEQTKLLLEAGAKPDERCLWNCRNAEKFILLLEVGADKSFKLPLQESEIIRLLKKYAHGSLDVNGLCEVTEKLQTQAQIAKSKERLKNKPKLSSISGTVIADKIAKKQISGEEKRIITPKVGKELRQKIMKDLKKSVKE